MLPRDLINLAHLPSPVTNKHVITNIYMMQISVETCKYEPVSLLIERGQYYCNLVTIVDSIDYSNVLPSIHIDKISHVCICDWRLMKNLKCDFHQRVYT